MNANPVAGSLVTVMFAVTGVYYLTRSVIGFSWADRVNNVTHVLMSLVMVAMPWPIAASIPTAVQVIVFTAATLWYAYLLLFRPGGDLGPLLGHHGGSVPLLWYHAYMMASMVWMAVAMSPAVATMPGMSMDPAGASMTGSAGWADAVSVVAGVLFVPAAVWFVVLIDRSAARGVHGRRGLAVLLDAAGSAVTAAGMAIAFLVLMT